MLIVDLNLLIYATNRDAANHAAARSWWESALSEFRDHPWVGAHLGGNPEDLVRLQRMLDAYPNLAVDDIRAAITYAAAVIAHEEIV